MWGQTSTIISIITLSKGGRESARRECVRKGGRYGREKEGEGKRRGG